MPPFLDDMEEGKGRKRVGGEREGQASQRDRIHTSFRHRKFRYSNYTRRAHALSHSYHMTEQIHIQNIHRSNVVGEDR